MENTLTHLSDDDLILVYYQELESPHLLECGPCQARMLALKRTLDAFDAAPAPERSQDYGAWVWHRIRPGLRRVPVVDWRRWAMAAAILLLMAGAFFAGRWTRSSQPPVANRMDRNRVLLAALNQHLERSCVVLTELANLPDSGDQVELGEDQRRAEDLLTANRLYRTAVQTANGDPATVQLLEEMERVLLEVAHSPARVGADEFEAIRERIRDRGIVFKARVVGQTIEEVLEQ